MSKDTMVKLDDKSILSIGWPEEPQEFNQIVVGENGITKIDCAEQFCGDYSTYWLQVWKGGKLFARYNARNVDTIRYKDE